MVVTPRYDRSKSIYVPHAAYRSWPPENKGLMSIGRDKKAKQTFFYLLYVRKDSTHQQTKLIRRKGKRKEQISTEGTIIRGVEGPKL